MQDLQLYLLPPPLEYDENYFPHGQNLASSPKTGFHILPIIVSDTNFQDE